MKKIKKLLFLCFLCLAAGCQAVKTDRPVVMELTQTTTRAAEITGGTTLPNDVEPATLTKTAAAHVLPTQTLTPPPTPTPTVPSWERIMPSFPMPLPTAKAAVEELLKTNGGCSLPCWWGIEPGKTSWVDTYQILAPISSEQVNIYNINGDKSFSAGFEIFVNKHKIIQEYIVYNNIIDFLEIRFNGSTSYTLSDLITTYGMPEEVWISTINQDVQGIVPFDLLLGYPNIGILAYFHSMDAKIKGGQVQKCYLEENAIVLDLWNPVKKENIEQISTEAPMFLGMVAFDEFQPLEATTDLDIKKFGEIFRVRNHTVCLDTPTKFWKSPFE